MGSKPTESAARRVCEESSWVTVEVNDLESQITSRDPDIPTVEEKQYRVVEILGSGWVRCVWSRELHEDDPEDYDNPDVDYFPPARVNAVFGIEKEESS